MTELIGFILPPFIDLINTRIADSRLRYVISMALCLAIGAVIRINELQAGDIGTVLKSAGIIFAEAQTVYKLYWEKSKERKTLQKTFK